MGLEITRILICTFFFMVLINGFNLIDGANCLCSLYSFIITVMIILLSRNLEIIYIENELIILLLALLVFISFNFFGKNFLGDGAAYGFGFLFGYILIKISILNINVSPYFIANLLWYPALENLFSIARRSFFEKNNYLPDNEHLHHLIFVYLEQNLEMLKLFL
jgi:UDP-GlcNAc:undecaprenyl-phosphate GlcNAc-1-phosphate transferase